MSLLTVDDPLPQDINNWVPDGRLEKAEWNCQTNEPE